MQKFFYHAGEGQGEIPTPPRRGSARGRFLLLCSILSAIYLIFSFALNAAYADPPASPYTPGETLTPTCSPTSTDCTVLPPLFSTTTLPMGGILYMNDASGTVTAATTSLYWDAVVPTFQIGTTPGQSTTSSLLLLGSGWLSGGNVSGTWIGIDAASSSDADLIDLQANSSTLFKIASSGAITVNESAGTQFQVLATAVPTNDLFHIANSPGTAVTAAGINNIQSDYYGGVGAVEAANVKLTVTAGPTSGSIWDGIRIVENTTTQAGVTENAIKIDPITNSTGTENAIFVGNGWQTGLIMAGNPAPQASSSLIQLASTTIEGGNAASGTFLGINPASFGGDFLDFQINSSTKFDVEASGSVIIGTTTPAASSLLTVAGMESLGIASATEGELTLFNSLTNLGVTLQASTSTTGAFTLTLPSSTGASGQSLITDGKGNLSWGSTGFTISVATTTVLALPVATTTYLSTGLHPSSIASQVWITGDIVASTTAQSSTITVAAYRGASACTTQVGNSISVELSHASGTAVTAQQQGEITINVIDSPATTGLQSYTLCARANAASLATAISGTLTLQEIRAGSDIAETYNAATDTPLTAGDVVSLDPTIDAGVMQSQSAYDSTLLGVVSTQPGAVLGNNDPDSGSSVLVALAGRVPVNVTNDNGDINVGDQLTSSDITGLAMRSTGPGRVVGVAMESFAPDPSTGITTGTILMFVNPGWSLGNLTSTSDIASSSWAIAGTGSSGQSILDQFTAYVQVALAKLGVAVQDGVATLQGVVANTVNTNELCVQGTCVNGSQLNALINNSGENNTAATTTSAAAPADGGSATTTPDIAQASSSANTTSSVTDDAATPDADASSTTNSSTSSE